MAVTIDGLKDFGGHSASTANTTTLELCMQAAVDWLAAAGVSARSNSSAYDLAVYRLATHYYDTRGNQEADRDAVPPTVVSLMHQLRSAPPAGDTGGAEE